MQVCSLTEPVNEKVLILRVIAAILYLYFMIQIMVTIFNISYFMHES